MKTKFYENKDCAAIIKREMSSLFFPHLLPSSPNKLLHKKNCIAMLLVSVHNLLIIYYVLIHNENHM